MKKVQIDAIDTWFFRDSSPFDANAGAMMAGGVFPPLPSTVSGALRAVIARGLGWSGQGTWDDSLHATVGDGPDDWGQLSFTGPFIHHETHGVLVPVPQNLLISKDSAKLNVDAALKPGAPVHCDLGPQVRLPRPVPELSEQTKARKPEQPAGVWTRIGEVLKLLHEGEFPKSLILESEMFARETRIGLERENRRAKEGHLYSANHIRLSEDPRITLISGVQGAPENAFAEAPVFRLGGESRLAEVQDMGSFGELQPKAVSGRSFTLVALTPLVLETPWHPGMQLSLGGQELSLETLCSQRPAVLGGWDSKSGGPASQSQMVPAGTVMYLKAAEKLTLNSIEYAGLMNTAGYGCVALGQGFCGKEEE